MHRGQAVFGLGVVLGAVLVGCGSDGPGSEVGQPGGGSAGTSGTTSMPVLGLGGGGAGSGGAGGSSGSGGATQGGAGAANQAGTGGAGGSGGMPATAMCERSAGSDTDCVEFWEDDKTQAYACESISAYSSLNNMHAGNCGSVNFVAGAAYGACCPP
jgi:hypothetical protein